jgi:hypothetical protein
MKTGSLKKHLICSFIITGLALTLDWIGHTFQINPNLDFMAKIISLFNPNTAASIGIIGGADGPTAYFYTGSPLRMAFLYRLPLLLILVVLYKPIKCLVSK